MEIVTCQNETGNNNNNNNNNNNGFIYSPIKNIYRNKLKKYLEK